VRDAVVGEVPPSYAGYVAWRGLVEEAAVEPALFPLFAFCLPPGEQMLGYPVAGRDNDLRPGRRRYNWVWYRPVGEAGELPRLLTDAEGRTHAVSIPPPLIRPELTAELQARARALLAPAFASVVEATEMPLLQPIYDLQSPLLSAGRVALIGDAAFVARPHVGAGTTKAAEDAAALAAALDEDEVPAALRRYEAERRPAGERFLRRARHLGSYLQAQHDRETAARHAGAAAVLAETAVLTF
jgi:2-polyprenyl-6-methoxyphenol hydroxylase-like FAD-dependent oxidoreductase